MRTRSPQGNEILLAVDQAFYNVLETKALMHVADETVKARQDLVDRVAALTNAKLRSDLDLSFSKVDLARAKLLLLESQNSYQASLSTLSAILGYPQNPGSEPRRGRGGTGNPAGRRSIATDSAGHRASSRNSGLTE